MQIAGVAAAPVSFGVFGTPSDDASWGRDAERLLQAVASGGYSGIELGPPRFFGPPQAIRDRLARHGLRLAGAYIPLHLADAWHRDDDFRAMRQTLEELAAGGGTLAILADWGSETLMSQPARRWQDRSLALDDGAWSVAAETLRRAIDLASEFDLRTTFHPHVATYVESPWEIARLLETVDIGLTIDTGHVWLAGASPTELLRTWGSRVDHVHLKDVHESVMRQAKADGRRDFETWWADVSCPLGEGDVDLDGFLQGLRAIGYQGWLVVEQDRAPAGFEAFDRIARVQATNYRWVRDRLSEDEVIGVRSGHRIDVEPP
jgi:inosose dehydratase